MSSKPIWIVINGFAENFNLNLAAAQVYILAQDTIAGPAAVVNFAHPDWPARMIMQGLRSFCQSELANSAAVVSPNYGAVSKAGQPVADRRSRRRPRPQKQMLTSVFRKRYASLL
jgi:hypothetical protein